MSLSTRAALLTATGAPLEVCRMDLAPPGPREVLVRIGASGVCHSDVLIQHNPATPKPMVLGHEGAGTILEVGADVTRVRPGDRVALNWNPYCGACYCCRAGQTFLCDVVEEALVKGELPAGGRRLSRAGSPVSHSSVLSTHAELAVVDEMSCVVLPEGMPLVPAALLGCGVPTGFGAVTNAARVSKGASIAVFGAGGIGINAVQAARLAGAEIIVACDLKDSNLEASRRFGATHTVNVGTEDVRDALLSLTAGRGVDYAIDTTGKTAATAQAWTCVRTGGTVVVVGRYTEQAVAIEAAMFHRRGKTLRGSLYGDIDPHRDIRRLAELYLDGQLLLDELVLSCIPLDGINDALASFGDASRPNVGHNVIVF